MPSILDFFKPVGKGNRPLNENALELMSENLSEAALLPLCWSSDAQKKSRKGSSKKDAMKLLSRETLVPLKKRQATKVHSQVTHEDRLDRFVSATSEETIELSEYERKRQTKMAANARFLKEMGVHSSTLELTKQLKQDRTINAKKRAKPEHLSLERPVRRSRRLRGEAAPESPRVNEEMDPDSQKQDAVGMNTSSVESNVLRYTVNNKCNDPNPLLSSPLDSIDRKLTGFHVNSKSYLYDNALKKAYDISFTSFQENGLVAMGGHGGRVSIFALSDSFHQLEENDKFVNAHKPLMSFKAHTGWISAISLARSIQGQANLLFTASNDASLKLWDLNQCSAISKTPKEIVVMTSLHQKGIFGMDCKENFVLTCSKDTTIALSQVRTDKGLLETLRRFEQHEGVVKCVRFAHRNPQIFASGGNDRVLRVYDARIASTPTILAITSVHSRAINSVQFHPTDDNFLLSAGFDSDFYMFDLRYASKPVCTYNYQYNGTSKAIFSPIFVQKGLGIVAARGHDLSLYRTSDGVVLSCGYIEEPATCVAADPFQNRIAIAQGGKMHFADAKWEH